VSVGPRFGARRGGLSVYKVLEVLGPEHEFSVVDSELRALPIVDRVLRDFHGRLVNFVERSDFVFGKELQLHVMELRPIGPFRSPVVFEETMHGAVRFVSDFVGRRYGARLLGTGMHPLVRLWETEVWPHRHRQIYEALSRVFCLRRHGWLNIQSFQLNLPYGDERSGVRLHNVLANVCAYLPAVAASSPVYEGRFGEDVDNRLSFYRLNQREVPSVTGDVVPEYVSSFDEYRREIVERYSADMAAAGAEEHILHKDWVNSRGVIFRFDRRALEIRVMDEQECIKSDVALSCFVRALLRGLLREESELLPHEVLVRDYNSVVAKGLNAETRHPAGRTARQVCRHLLHVAMEHATDEEKDYLPIVKERIEGGNLSDLIQERIGRRARKSGLREAIVRVYSELVESLIDNQPYF
jgi:gamma-glutamyl:cysteine ligase YbdK (ATP-grasp superfamily)